MFTDRCEQSHIWETHLYPKIHKKVEELVQNSSSLWVSQSDSDNYEVLDENNNTINMHKEVLME